MATILICDDIQPTAEAIAHYLMSKGHVVHESHTFAESLEALEADRRVMNFQHRYAVAIIDLEFTEYPKPNEKGLEIFEVALKHRFLESIILTAHFSQRSSIRAVDGAFAYMVKGDETNLKPSFFENLGRVVDRAVAVREQTYSVYKALMDLDDTVTGDLLDGLPAQVRTYLAAILTNAQMQNLAILAAHGRHTES